VALDVCGVDHLSHRHARGVDLLRKLVQEGVTDCSELAEELKVSKGTISKWAHKGIEEGWLFKEGRCYGLKT
jgi:transposase